jgi:hypothetical protein
VGLSADGRYVALTSSATNLVAGVTDTASSTDLFLYDRLTGGMTLVSHATADPAVAVGAFANASLSADGDGTLAASTSIAGSGTVHVILDVNGYFE